MLADRIQAGARCLRDCLGDGGSPAVEILGPVAEGRVVAAYTTEAGTYVGKFYRDSLGTHASEALQAIGQRLLRFRPPVVLAVPGVVSYEPEIRCLLQEYAPGVGFESCENPERRLDFQRLAGRALAELHSLPPLDEPAKTLRDHVAELVRPRPGRLVETFPEYGPAVRSALARMAAIESMWPTSTVAPIHRDFHLRQLRRDGDRMWVVDWDSAANGDPAFDVAYFIVYLQNHMTPESAAAAVSAFVAGYVEVGDPDVLNRLAAYKIFNYLRRACRRFRLQDADWKQEMRLMLGRMRSATVLG